MSFFSLRFASSIAISLLSFLVESQPVHPFKNICLSPPVPPVFIASDSSSPTASRSGNNYSIPFDTITYNSTLGSQGFDVVICIDGAVNNAQIALADNYVDSLVARFQSVAHYQPRFKYFNIYRIAKLSNEEGASWGYTGDTLVNNRYGSRFNAYGLPRLLIPQKPDTLFADINEFVAQIDLVLLLVFDKKYGGSGISYYDGRKVACFSIDEETGYHLSDEVIIHEMQHVMPFAGHGYLGDEYEDSLACIIYDTIPESPNVTSDTISNRKWQHCVGLNGIGFFEDAGICDGNYRPVDLCAMRQVYNFPDFCPVCRENSTAYFDSIINPIYYRSQLPTTFVGSYVFTAEVDTPTINTYRTQWWLNDSLIVENSNSAILNFDLMDKSRNHVLKFICTDIDQHIVDTSLRRPWIITWDLQTQDSTISFINRVNPTPRLELFPNPASDELNVIIQGNNLNGLISIISTNGHILIKDLPVFKGCFKIDISGLPRGIFFLAVKSEQEFSVSKFIRR